MGWVERVMAIVAGIAVVASVSAMIARSDPQHALGTASVSIETPPAVTDTPALPVAAPKATPRRTTVNAGQIGALSTIGTTAVRAKPWLDAKTVSVLPSDVLLPVIARNGRFFKVLTPEEVFGWVHASKARTHLKAVGKAANLEDATIVIDPGHGGRLPGAKGPGGLLEKDVNLGISRRLADRLSVARVFVTRGGGHAGLAYRAALANRLNAHTFISVHNNALPDRLSKEPGTEVYYQRRSNDSKRLAGLIYEELFQAFKRFNIKWGRDPFAGAKYRISHEHGGEYYAVLRRTLVPAVISEGMFITNKHEERLLSREPVRQLYADALARAVKRYFNTDDPGSGFRDPYAKPTPNCPIPGCFEHRK